MNSKCEMQGENTERSDRVAPSPYQTDTANQKEVCPEDATAVRRDDIYDRAVALMKESMEDELTQAISLFESIPGWKDADAQADACRARLKGIKALEEADQQVVERWAREERMAAEKRKKGQRLIVLILVLLAMLGIGAFFLWTRVIRPDRQYAAVLSANVQHESRPC